MLTLAASAFLVNVSGGIFNWLVQKAGRGLTQVLLFVISFAVAYIWYFRADYPGFWNLVMVAGVIFSIAVAFYEVALNKLSFFSGPAA